jgi:N-methylhydantoinase A
VYPTITDANLFLDRLAPEYFLGGAMTLYPERSAWALNRLSKEAGLSPIETRQAVAVNAHMERALIQEGAMTIDFTLLSFGGRLHAVELARRLGIPRAGALQLTLSALGMLAADVVRDYTHR